MEFASLIKPLHASRCRQATPCPMCSGPNSSSRRSSCRSTPAASKKPSAVSSERGVKGHSWQQSICEEVGGRGGASMEPHACDLVEALRGPCMLSVGVRARLSLLARQLDWSQRSVNALIEKLNLAAASVNEMPPAVPRAAQRPTTTACKRRRFRSASSRRYALSSLDILPAEDTAHGRSCFANCNVHCNVLLITHSMHAV